MTILYFYFYDAAAPIVSRDSIDMSIAYWGDRYTQERGREESEEEWRKRIADIREADYLNLPMNKEEYILNIQNKYDEYLMQTENRGISYGELAYIQNLNEKELSKGEFRSVKQAVGGIDAMLNEKCKDQDALALIQYISDDEKEEKLLEN